MRVSDIMSAVAQVAPAYPVLTIDLFGSFPDGENTTESDVDLLVHFDERTATLFDLSGLKLDLEARLKTEVDVVAGPLRRDRFLKIEKMARIYVA